jgi:hypothetical protein
MFLATEAIGLGGWMHCGIMSREIFEALGFRAIVPRQVSALANPIGLNGIFEAYCPPYFSNMDAAVDTVLAPLLRPRSTTATPDTPPGAVPYLISDAEHRAGSVEISKEGIACTKAVCNYIYDTYGRFPGWLRLCVVNQKIGKAAKGPKLISFRPELQSHTPEFGPRL